MVQRDATHTDELTPEQVIVVDSLLCGRTVSESADTAGVHRATVWRWTRHDPAFIVALNAGKAEVYEQANSRLLRLTSKAVDAIERALDDGDPKIALALLRQLGMLDREPPVGAVTPNEAALEVGQRERESLVGASMMAASRGERNT